ncbi:MAG: hypothetical protein JSV22_12870 [Bacteroidales bacterium]|nr:MAG: hypothetical protein JSV22_12870 [Bacteroidales bacterium]
MKKTVLFFIAICLFSFAANGQFFDLSDGDEATGEPLISKGGHNILPEKGDIGLAIDAIPFTDFIGNLVKINSGAAFSSMLHIQPPEGGMIICLKYFTGNKTALRAKFRIAYDASTEKLAVQNDDDPLETVYDTEISSDLNFDIGIGLEKRRGHTRLQGLYGLEGILSVTKGGEATPNMRYKYANEFSSANTAPTTSRVGRTSSRPIYQKIAPQYGIGGRGFVGIEYYFTPKIAIGGEIAVRLEIARRGASKVKTESWNFTDGAVEKDVTKDRTPSGSDISLDNEIDTHLYLIVCF